MVDNMIRDDDSAEFNLRLNVFSHLKTLTYIFFRHNVHIYTVHERVSIKMAGAGLYH